MSSAAPKRTLVMVRSAEEARVEEALRAALGLTLRGASVTVWLDATPALSATARRAIAALQSFGHHVGDGPGADAEGAAAVEVLAEMDAVEIWT